MQEGSTRGSKPDASDFLQPATANDSGNWELRGAGPDAVFNTADDPLVNLSMPAPYVSGTTITLDVQDGKTTMSLDGTVGFSRRGWR